MRIALVVAVATVAVMPAFAQAQQRPPARRQAPIEIRGQVPTPQVVTVRPREVPSYDRRVLVPTFYDHDFWQSILPGYLLVREHLITGQVPGDTTARRDSTARTSPMTPPPAGTIPPASTLPPPAAMSPPVAEPRAILPAAGSSALPPR